MFILIPHLVVILLITSDSYGENLCKSNRAFLFPNEPHSAYPKLMNVPFPDNAKEFSISVWAYQTRTDRMQPLMSYAAENQPNAFFVGFSKVNQIYAIANKKNKFNVYPEINRWWHVVVTWQSDTGLLRFFYNGTLGLEKPLKSSIGFKLGGNGILIPGQLQNEVGGGFKKQLSWRGQLTSINVWDRKLTDEEAAQVFRSEIEGNIVAWSKTIDQYELVSDVKLIDTSAGIRKNCDGKGTPSETSASTSKKSSLSKRKKTQNKVSIDIYLSEIFDNAVGNANAHVETCNGDIQYVNATFQKFGDGYSNIVNPLKEAVIDSTQKVGKPLQNIVDSTVKTGNSIQNSVKGSAKNKVNTVIPRNFKPENLMEKKQRKLV